MRHFHSYHLVNLSPWPILTALSALQLVLSLLYYFFFFSSFYFLFSICQLIFIILNWAVDMNSEGTHEGMHTFAVQSSMRKAMVLFIVSEVAFFATFFWAFFYYSISPSIWIGCVWPPQGAFILDPFALPLVNTILLLVSGLTVTCAHNALLMKWSRRTFLIFLFLTIILGVSFLFCQYLEYNNAGFSITDTVFGSIFYLLTGFHGFHVLMGVVLLTISFIRAIFYQFSATHHIGFECAAW
jgi:cytochrome c oxidase subunit 3